MKTLLYIGIGVVGTVVAIKMFNIDVLKLNIGGGEFNSGNYDSNVIQGTGK